MAQLHFGWLAPVVGVAKSHYVPIVMAQEAEILPVVATHLIPCGCTIIFTALLSTPIPG